MTTKKIAILGITAAVFLLLFATFFWPGLYHYDKMSWGPLTYPIRINRITGRVQTNIDNEWTDGVGPQEKGWRELSPAEAKELESQSKNPQ